MTIEEAIREIQNMAKFNYTLAPTEVFDMAIKALEKELVLDKIRAEIEKEYFAEGHLPDYWDGIDKCLKIIDKYKAESEDKE